MLENNDIVVCIMGIYHGVNLLYPLETGPLSDKSTSQCWGGHTIWVGRSTL